MEPWRQLGQALWQEAGEDRSLVLLAGLVVALPAIRLLGAERRRLRSVVYFGLLHWLLLVPVAVLRATGSGFYVDLRLPCLIFEALAAVGALMLFLFTVLLPRLSLNLSRIFQDVVFGVVALAVTFSLSSRLGFNLSGVIATSAVATAVIGFALQDTFGNIAGGLAVQFDNSIRVGDWIKVGDLTGKVTDIRWRYTAIETRNWETAIVPNSVLTKNQVLVLGRRQNKPEQWRRWVWFNVDYRQSPSEVIQIVTQALRSASIERVAKDPPPNCVLMDLQEGYGRYAVRYWLTDLAVDDPTDSVVRTWIFLALKRAGISPAIPAEAVFVTQESRERSEQKTQRHLAEAAAAIAKVELFHTLSEEERMQLARSLKPAPFTRGEVITRQHAEAHWLYLLVRGDASVRVEAPDGGEVEVNQLHGGDFFGEMSLMTGAPRSATVVALTDVECYRLDRAGFEQVIQRRPEIAEHVADVLSRRRVELLATLHHLDEEAKAKRLAEDRVDLLGKVRDFFGLRLEGSGRRVGSGER